MTILADILTEREVQKYKWGDPVNSVNPTADINNTPADWFAIINDYNAWARRMACRGSPDKARKRLIQIAAIAIAQVEMIDYQQTMELGGIHNETPD